MSDVTKVLMDDHRRLRRMLLQNPAASMDVALDICDELTIHSTIEEELVYPALRNVDPGLADESEAEHDEFKELMAAIEELEPEDHDELMRLMRELKGAVERHIEMEERVAIPKLNATLADQLLEMGSEAFAMRQELLGQRRERKHSPPPLANTGWLKRNRVPGTANTGWG